MQKYTEIEESKTLRESRELLLSNDKTAISCSSGPAFPTINLQPGMLCFRTDEQKLYQLNVDGETWVELFDLSSNAGLVSRATTANNALKANGHTVNADVPVNAKFTDTTYGAVTDSASGLMTAAQKKKLDGLSNYSLPVASATTLGGVKIGDGLTITNGIVSSSVNGGNATHGEKLFTANGTFVVPEGVSFLVVTAVGGGGGGGGGGYSGNHDSGQASGNSGTQGVMIENRTVFVNGGQTLAVIIGLGGNGGNGGVDHWTGGAGGAAGDSSTGTAGNSGAGTGDGRGAGGGGGGAGGATKLGEIVIARGGNGGAGGVGGVSWAYGGTGGNTSSKIAVSAESLEMSSYLNSHRYGVYGAAGAGGAVKGRGGNGTAGFLFIRW